MNFNTLKFPVTVPARFLLASAFFWTLPFNPLPVMVPPTMLLKHGLVRSALLPILDKLCIDPLCIFFLNVNNIFDFSLPPIFLYSFSACVSASFCRFLYSYLKKKLLINPHFNISKKKIPLIFYQHLSLLFLSVISPFSYLLFPFCLSHYRDTSISHLYYLFQLIPADCGHRYPERICLLRNWLEN